MTVRYIRPGRTPFFIYQDDIFRMAAFNKDGKFIGWREKGKRFPTREAAQECADKAKITDFRIGEIL